MAVNLPTKLDHSIERLAAPTASLAKLEKFLKELEARAEVEERTI